MLAEMKTGARVDISEIANRPPGWGMLEEEFEDLQLAYLGLEITRGSHARATSDVRRCGR